VGAAKAAQAHAQTMADFEQVRSPIAGTVTARNVEVGNLVSGTGTAQGVTPVPGAGPTGGPPTGGAQGGELFYVVNLDRLEVFVTVPEEDAQFVQGGQSVQLSFSEMPGQTFQGKVVRTSDSLSQQTRTLLAEMRVTDPQHRLRPGMFATVQMRYKAPNPGILIPGDSLITMARGEFVPVVKGGCSAGSSDRADAGPDGDQFERWTGKGANQTTLNNHRRVSLQLFTRLAEPLRVCRRTVEMSGCFE
jgi:multidrug efflux pump subunit AcrA (membrane-fusion protein)